MAWTAPATVITGDLLTAALWNAQVRDNMLETAAATAAAAGDAIYADAPNSMGGRVAASANKYLGWNAAGTALEAKTMPYSLPANQWGHGTARRYTMRANPDASDGTQSGVAYLNNGGWENTAGAAVGSLATATTGDMNAITDDDQPYVHIPLAGVGGSIGSPKVIGGASMIQGIAALDGATPTTITVGIIASVNATTASAADGIGISNDRNAPVATSGVIAIINGATNFEYAMDGAAGVSLAVAKDTALHKYEFVINVAAMTMDIKIDGTTRATGVALIQDVWPKGIYVFTANPGTVAWRLHECWVNYD